MATLDDSVFDAGLNVIKTGTILHICSAAPANYAGIAAVTLGNKATPTFTGPTNGDVSGRKVTVDAITGGTVTGTATAAYWALATGSVLLGTGALTAPQAVTTGNTFTLSAFDIEMRDPT